MYRREVPTTDAARNVDDVPAALRQAHLPVRADGDPHESPALVYTVEGRTKTMTLSAAEVAEVAAAISRYEAARAELDDAAAAGLARLRGRRAERSRGGRS